MANENQLLQQIINGDYKTLARAISQIENKNADVLLRLLPSPDKNIIGITGPPGAGKSTLADCLISHYINQQKKVGVLCIDPSSAFSRGALLGDRIRMNRWHNNENVFIRSLASRGNMGGLHPAIIEITDVMKAAPFDIIIIETVGAGQTETEIASLADVTVVVLVPEAGDDIQMMKAGLIEIADVFVINKSDRKGADELFKNLSSAMHIANRQQKEIAVIKTVASENKGIDELAKIIQLHSANANKTTKKVNLLANKAYVLIQQKRMNDISKTDIAEIVKKSLNDGGFNLYKLAEDYYKSKA